MDALLRQAIVGVMLEDTLLLLMKTIPNQNHAKHHQQHRHLPSVKEFPSMTSYIAIGSAKTQSNSSAYSSHHYSMLQYLHEGSNFLYVVVVVQGGELRVLRACGR